MEFVFDNTSPIWKQLATQLKERIVAGEYAPGDHFPAVRELASEAEVNPNTMQRAMTLLESEGLLVTNRTSGRTVTSDMDVINGIKESLAEEHAGEFIRKMSALGYNGKSIISFMKSKLND